MKIDPKDFCYWLQGFSEISGFPPSHTQWEMIKEHLSLVFDKVTTKTCVTVDQVIVKQDGDNHIVPKTPEKYDWAKIFEGTHYKTTPAPWPTAQPYSPPSPYWIQRESTGSPNTLTC